MTLMRFDPSRELDRLAEQTLSRGARPLYSMPIGAMRRGDDQRPHGEFVRQLLVGDDLDADRLTADARAGVLTLTIPFGEAGKPRWVVTGSADRPSDAPNLLAWSVLVPAAAQVAAAAAAEPAPV